jgi:hypothetical protein
MSISSSEQSIYDQDYYTYHLELLTAFGTQLKELPPFNLENPSEDDIEFLAALTQLPSELHTPDFLENGQILLCRVVSNYPHLMPLLYRDLFWFFGGDCLHFMPDEEIAIFQALDEERELAREQKIPFTYKEVRAKRLGMH